MRTLVGPVDAVASPGCTRRFSVRACVCLFVFHCKCSPVHGDMFSRITLAWAGGVVTDACGPAGNERTQSTARRIMNYARTISSHSPVIKCDSMWRWSDKPERADCRRGVLCAATHLRHIIQHTHTHTYMWAGELPAPSALRTHAAANPQTRPRGGSFDEAASARGWDATVCSRLCHSPGRRCLCVCVCVMIM